MTTLRRPILVLSLAILPATSSAQGYGSLYDGNSYTRYGTGYSGYNTNTGSTWNAQSYGSMTRGTDSKGNSWSYDNSSGIYQNYGTGEIRTPIDRLYNGR
ncbi:hypothetical protein F2Q65_09340 [Thiohalocapsa marina]|uniref:Uncharacterized protein n=1 Tax=Thiohalocapsa marina TaxID=424902 RepID=A0A5M8FK51_9GAMM|nr:hypothetical protein [Thiohalocapsa marina]KAA6185293.1 hypothetical protein F2Q65_09340 [Thiohalocapsa marina]